MPKICGKPTSGRKPKISCGRRDYQRGEQLRQQLCHQVCPKCATSLQVLVVHNSSINSRQLCHQVCPKCAEPSSLPIQAASQVDIFEKVLMPHSPNRLVEDTVDIFEKVLMADSPNVQFPDARQDWARGARTGSNSI